MMASPDVGVADNHQSTMRPLRDEVAAGTFAMKVMMIKTKEGVGNFRGPLPGPRLPGPAPQKMMHCSNG